MESLKLHKSGEDDPYLGIETEFQRQGDLLLGQSLIAGHQKQLYSFCLPPREIVYLSENWYLLLFKKEKPQIF